METLLTGYIAIAIFVFMVRLPDVSYWQDVVGFFFRGLFWLPIILFETFF